MSTPSQRFSSMPWSFPLVNVFSMMALIAYHVHAEAGDVTIDMSLWARIISGPMYLTTMDKILFTVLVTLALQILNWLVKNSGVWMNSKIIPVRGKHLDELTSTDKLFIAISKAQTGPFTYLLLRFCFYETNVLWAVEDLSLRTVLLPLPALFIVFDFFYTIMHWALHIKAIYGYVHKHHHTQKAPSRANIDAINVHPLEFFLGEYNHMWSMFLCCRIFNLQIHILATLLFLVIGGALAGLNHTRFDIEINFFGIHIFDSKAHDVHHRIPQSNYGQYSMFWDYVFGTYRSYNPKDRVNPGAQLDEKSGKSIEYLKSRNLYNTNKSD